MQHPRPETAGADFLTPGNRLIGMVHVGPTPSSPRAQLTPSELVEHAASEAAKLANAGFDAIIVENMHDAPYVHGEALTPDVVSTMALCAHAAAEAFKGPMGVQILSGGNRHALAVTHATGGSFIRCENFVFAHVADEGLLAEAEAGALLRYRRSISAEHVGIFVDIKKKHASHAVTQDISITDAVEAAAFFGADAVIITGTSTGKATAAADVKEARDASDLPVLVGSGVSPETVAPLLDSAHALIVGSSIKYDGKWFNNIDPKRAEAIVRARDGHA